MYIHTAVFAVMLSVLHIEAHAPGQHPKCRSEEMPVEGDPRKDTFCKPSVTKPSKLLKLRKCVCKTGYVRNAWGLCISMSQCELCKDKPYQDYGLCQSMCPLTCGKEASRFCTRACVFGCACPPGFVRAPGKERKCVPISECPPKCPTYSTFEKCRRGCEPICGRPLPPKTCVPSCHDGGCVCQQGYAMKRAFARDVCVPIKECAKKLK